MKSRNLLLCLFILFFITSCSSDDNPSNDDNQNNETLKLYKKSELVTEGVPFLVEEVFYNQDSTINKIEVNEEGYVNRTFNVTYSENNIIEIDRISDYYSFPDTSINYNNITISDSSIILVSTNSDKTLEIYHSNGYVDSTRLYSTSNPNNVFDQTFTRNSNDQLISNESGEIFHYSNFDIDKKLDPFGSVMEYEHGIYFLLFGLSVTKNNPLTSTVQGQSYDSNLEYDEDGYVVQVSYGQNSSFYITHQYINQ